MTNYRFFAALRMTKGLELGADDEFVEVVDITLKVLSMVEFQCPGADNRLQCVNRIWQINKCKYITKQSITPNNQQTSL